MIDDATRSRFSRVLERSEIYLANHSLGRPLNVAQDDVTRGMDLWYAEMDEAWGAWLDEFAYFEAALKSIIGWPVEGAIVPKSNVGQSLRAVLNSFKKSSVQVVASLGEFDSVDFILKAYGERGLAQTRWVKPSPGPDGVPGITTDSYLEAITDSTDLVIVSLVQFTTGQLVPGVQAIIRRAHEVGAVVFLDTYHAAGVYSFSYPEADFAAGGCYKYLRGGTGACWLAVHPRHLSRTTLDTGWFAKKDTFSYARPEAAEREPGGRGWWESTPAVLPIFQARSGLDFTLEIGLETIRQIGLSQLATLRGMLNEFGGICPTNPEEWGGFALLPSPQSGELVRKLKDHGVNVDARGGYVRFGPDLLTTEVEMAEAVKILRRVLA